MRLHAVSLARHDAADPARSRAFSPPLLLPPPPQELLARLRSVGAFSGAPKLVAFVSLCPNLRATEVMQQALASEDIRVTATEGRTCPHPVGGRARGRTYR